MAGKGIGGFLSELGATALSGIGGVASYYNPNIKPNQAWDILNEKRAKNEMNEKFDEALKRQLLLRQQQVQLAQQPQQQNASTLEQLENYQAPQLQMPGTSLDDIGQENHIPEELPSQLQMQSQVQPQGLPQAQNLQNGVGAQNFNSQLGSALQNQGYEIDPMALYGDLATQKWEQNPEFGLKMLESYMKFKNDKLAKQELQKEQLNQRAEQNAWQRQIEQDKLDWQIENANANRALQQSIAAMRNSNKAHVQSEYEKTLERAQANAYADRIEQEKTDQIKIEKAKKAISPVVLNDLKNLNDKAGRVKFGSNQEKLASAMGTEAHNARGEFIGKVKQILMPRIREATGNTSGPLTDNDTRMYLQQIGIDFTINPEARWRILKNELDRVRGITSEQELNENRIGESSVQVPTQGNSKYKIIAVE